MNELKKHLRMLFTLFALVLLAACSSSNNNNNNNSDNGDDNNDDDDEIVVVEPIIQSLTFDDEEVRIGWSHALETGDDEDGGVAITYNLYYAIEQIEDDGDDSNDDEQNDEENLQLEDLLERFDSLQGATTFVVEENPFPISGLINDTTYFIVITATTSDGTSDPSDEVRATPRDLSGDSLVPVVLNDTGYTLCGDYAFNVDVDQDGLIDDDEGIDIINSGEHDNRIDCLNGAVDDDGDTLPPVAAQDASYGRDSNFADDSNGLAGFDFTKLDTSGNALAASATDWSCVQDNVTGLVWEVKTTDSGLHETTDRYSWYNTDTLSNGGFEGYERAEDFDSTLENDTCFDYQNNTEASYCNTAAFVDRVNAAGLCGASDWRMPTREELLGLVHFGLTNSEELGDPTQFPSIDTDYFPNTEVTTDQAVRYWTSSPYAAGSSFAWALYFGAGGSPNLVKGIPNAIRLVREP